MKPKNKNRGLESTLDTVRQQADRVENLAKRRSRKHVFSRLGNLREVRRSVVLWLSLLAVLILAAFLQSIYYSQSYQANGPAPGGTYAEGVVGEISSFNPLYASSEDEVAVSRLVYSSLLTLDDINHLRPSVAESFSTSGDGLVHDVKLRSDVKWYDSEDVVTADDVIFTVKLIQTPAVASPLYDTWRSVKVEKVDDMTVRFTLRSPLAAFPQVLTFGILSEKELSAVDPVNLREHLSENVATGSGPFYYRSTSTSQTKNKILSFGTNQSYFEGAPKVNSISMEVFSDATAMIDGWRTGEINVATDVPLAAARELAKSVPTNLQATSINRGVYAIFNTTNPITGNQAVRQALRIAIDREAVRQASSVGDRAPNELNSPIAPGIYASVDALAQPNFDQTEASRILDVEGWAMGKDKTRVSGDRPMELDIVTLRDSDYEAAANSLAEQWRVLGIDANVTLADIDTIQQNYIIPRNYDVLVYQLQLGADPDVYSYWHSSGAKAQGLNLANYSSSVTDLALSRARSGIDREKNYLTFVNNWLDDVPAIALYQADFFTLRGADIVNFDTRTLTDKSMRFRSVNNFSVNSTTVFKTP